MARFRLAAIVGLLAAAVVGCAHCDTCDDFPAPCLGGNCFGAAGGAEYGPAMPVMANAPIDVNPNPPMTSSPFSPPAPGTPAAGQSE